jgi:hypothetical protein
VLRRSVEALALKAAEQQRALRARQALVLDRVRHRQHRGLGQHLRLELGVARAQRRVHRGRLLVLQIVGELYRRLERESARAATQNRADAREILLGITAVSARHPAGLRELVPDLPHPQRRLADPAPRGHLAHRQAGLEG